MSISDNLKRIRKQRKLTQGELANLASVELSQISRIERGASEPKLETIKNLAIALDCTTDALIMGEDENNSGYMKFLLLKINNLTPLKRFALMEIIKAYCRLNTSLVSTEVLLSEYERDPKGFRTFDEYKNAHTDMISHEFKQEIQNDFSAVTMIYEEMQEYLEKK